MSSLAKRAELIVSGYIRALQKNLDMDIHDDIWLVVIMFYPNCIEFEGNTLKLTMKEKEIITSWFIDIFDLKDKVSMVLTSKLLYDYTKDGTKGLDFHKKCDGNTNTFSIIETRHDGHIFGCFTSQMVTSDQKPDYIKDDKAFLCVIRSCFKDKNAEIFKVKSEKIPNAYFHSKNWGPAFGIDDLTIMGDEKEISCCHNGTYFNGDLYGNVLCGGKELKDDDDKYEFDIKQMNTFTIQIDQN